MIPKVVTLPIQQDFVGVDFSIADLFGVADDDADICVSPLSPVVIDVSF